MDALLVKKALMDGNYNGHLHNGEDNSMCKL